MECCDGVRAAGDAQDIRQSASVTSTATHYGLSHPNRYRDTLGDEPVKMADTSIRNILDTEYPKAFWLQWTTDVAHWLSDGFSLKRSF